MKVLIDYSYSIWNTSKLLDYFIIYVGRGPLKPT